MKLFFCKRSIRLTTVVKQFLCGHPTILSLLPPSLMTMYMHLRCWKLIKSGETMGSIHVSLQQLGDHWACHGKCWSIVCSNVPVHTANGTKYLRVFTSLSTALHLVYMQDRFAFQQALPPIDPSQDWFLVRGEENSGYTILEFTRNWTTCDDRDRDIEVLRYHRSLPIRKPVTLQTFGQKK